VDPAAVRRVLRRLEQSGADVDLRPALALLAGRDVELDEEELNAARRRAMLLLAAGGDPHGGLALEGRAVTALADDLETDDRRAALANAVASLRDQAAGLQWVAAALDAMVRDERSAWRSFACALLAEEL
jgi:hypothetical protein